VTLRYLFGPVGKAFAEQNLHGPRQAGHCLAFNAEGDVDVQLRPWDSWETFTGRLPGGWAPDFLVLYLPYATVPACLWSAPLPRVGLAPDWPLLWHAYRRCLPGCAVVLTDRVGADRLVKEGVRQARPGSLWGCERLFLETTWPDGPRDVDILLVGNLNPAVQRERLPWLTRLARLGRRWRVAVRTGTFGESYARLLSRTRIVVQFSARGKCGRRSAEAAACGALIFQEDGNREVPEYFRQGSEYIAYSPEDLERLVEYYLEHEEERKALADAARVRARDYGFEQFWNRLVAGWEAEWPALRDGGQARADTDPVEPLLTRAWQTLGSGRFEDVTLLGDLEKAVEAEPQSAVLHNALGVMVVRQGQGRPTASAAAEVAAEHFRRALACQPGYALAGLNLAEALDAAGQSLGAVEAARRTLEILSREPDVEAQLLDGLPLGQGFDTFRIEWERAAWANAGRPTAEGRDKLALVRWRLHTLLGRWTGELPYFYEAVVQRPDLPPSRTALGVALTRAGHTSEAVPHLQQALADNPLDREAAFTLGQALLALGDIDGRRRLVEDRRLLAQAAPAVVPHEPWFADPRPRGNELASIIILCCNQLDYTRQCLESLLRHTRAPYELILVDNASTDGTAEYLEEVRRRPGPARVEVIRNDTNRGFPAGCNQGLARARGRYIVLLNNDTRLTPGWLDGLVAWALHDWPAVGMVGPVTNNAPDAQKVPGPDPALDTLDAFALDRRRAFAGQTLSVKRLTGFCLLVRREVLDRVGSFDERYGIGFFDDDDLCVRAREAGFRLHIALDVFVYHHGNRTFQALGINSRDKLVENFDRFRAKWGQEYAAGYFLPPPPPAPADAGAPAAESQTAEPAPSEEVVAAACGEHPPEPAAAGGDAAPAVPAEPIAPKQGKTLSMIVRNEEHHLGDCLRSFAGLFDQVVVTDTGSTDKTREVARALGAEVYEFPWADSFGAARNACLRHARGAWVMFTDADDRLDAENRPRLERVLAECLSGGGRDARVMKVRSFLDPGRTSARLLDQVRLFPNLRGAWWDYRIHEQILPSLNRLGGGVCWTNVIIDHVGYVDAAARRGKLERNLRLLELDHAERPDDAFTLFNLGWTLLDLGRVEEALAHLEHALKQTNRSSSTLRKLYHLLAVACRTLQRPDDALARCREGLVMFPDDAELLCEEGLMHRDRGDLLEAERSWQRLLDGPRGQYFASEEVGLRGFRTRQLLAEIYRAQGRHSEAEVQWRAALAERHDFEPAWQGLAEQYLRQSRWSDLEYLLQKLEGQGVPWPRLGWMRARGQVQRKEHAAARQTLERVIAADPTALGPVVQLSQVLLAEGRDWQAAEAALRRVLELNPNHAETRHNLTLLLRRLGREVPGT
jgi:GT2 family glycosyltransferase/tetratricopeptide (TPR) repeat protein